MSDLSVMEVREIKTPILQAKALEKTMDDILNRDVAEHCRYTSFKDMAQIYNDLVNRAKSVMKFGSFYTLNTQSMRSPGDTLWGEAKSILESVLTSTRFLIVTLESQTDFVSEEIENIGNFFKTKLRSVVFDTPSKEKEIQNVIGNLLLEGDIAKG